LQWEVYSAEHIALHHKYAPTKLPTLEQAIRVIDDEYEKGGLLKLGSIGDPIYNEISRELMIQINKVYGEMRSV
jgi:hypothetical protein